MQFIDRHEESRRLDWVARGTAAALVVVWGRRRVGKSRLLTEWTTRHGGLYWVADESAATIQRRYLADQLEAVLPDFAHVDYPDWAALLSRLSRDAAAIGWHGPLVLDEFPYLVAHGGQAASPNTPAATAARALALQSGVRRPSARTSAPRAAD